MVFAEFNAGGNATVYWHPIQGRILLVSSCYRNQRASLMSHLACIGLGPTKAYLSPYINKGRDVKTIHVSLEMYIYQTSWPKKYIYFSGKCHLERLGDVSSPAKKKSTTTTTGRQGYLSNQSNNMILFICTIHGQMAEIPLDFCELSSTLIPNYYTCSYDQCYKDLC